MNVLWHDIGKIYIFIALGLINGVFIEVMRVLYICGLGMSRRDGEDWFIFIFHEFLKKFAVFGSLYIHWVVHFKFKNTVIKSVINLQD